MLINAGLLAAAGDNSGGFNGRPFMIEYGVTSFTSLFFFGGGGDNEL
jgi:hypothetical protein